MRLYGTCQEDFIEWRHGSGRTVEILNIAVNSTRREGRGRAMIQKLLNEIKQSDAWKETSLIFAITRIGNTIAQQFYEACGFRLIGRLHNFYRDGINGNENALMYGLDI